MITDRRNWLARWLDVCSPALSMLGRCPCRRCSAHRNAAVLRAFDNARRAWRYGDDERARCRAKCQRAAAIIREQQQTIARLRAVIDQVSGL